MLRLRKILLCNTIFYVFLFLTLIITMIRLLFPYSSNYSEESSLFSGIVTDIHEKDHYQTISIRNKEMILANYTIQNNERMVVQLGDLIEVRGSFQRPKKNTVKYLFNYQRYCFYKRIFYIVDVEEYRVIKKHHSLYYFIKQKIKNRLGDNAYLNTFILGDKYYLSDNGKRSYQENGVSHLFAISGMHISLLSMILEKILKKIKCSSGIIFKVTGCFLVVYLFIVGFSPSILRGVLFYLLFSLNHIYYFYMDKKNIFILILSLALLINPYYLFDVGFLYSYFISFVLLMHAKYLNNHNSIISLLQVSLLSFIVGLPITLFSYQQVNLFSILYNLLFVPFVSLFLFPFSLIVFFIKPLEPIYNLLTTGMENVSIFLQQISIFKIIFKRLPFIVYVLYFSIILFSLFSKKKKILFLLLLFLCIHFFLPFFEKDDYLEMIDVGQGDSILIHLGHQTILMDTGGLWKEGDLFYNTLYPLLKSRGIHKISFLILSHGDKDHMGEALTLVRHFKVEKVIFNCGEYNDMEKKLIHTLKKKRISYESCIQELSFRNNTFYFLNTKEYDNENDNSNVIYTEINGYTFLFMGDAGIPKEKDLLQEYELPTIDVLKVGHHGSKTCSSNLFIDKIQPQYSLISVGKDNKFNHPNEGVLDILKDSKIYRTDQDGSIMIRIKNNKLNIDTYSP